MREHNFLRLGWDSLVIHTNCLQIFFFPPCPFRRVYSWLIRFSQRFVCFRKRTALLQKLGKLCARRPLRMYVCFIIIIFPAALLHHIQKYEKCESRFVHFYCVTCPCFSIRLQRPHWQQSSQHFLFSACLKITFSAFTVAVTFVCVHYNSWRRWTQQPQLFISIRNHECQLLFVSSTLSTSSG